MTEQQVLEFIAWLATQNMQICGPVFNGILGTSYMTELDEADYINVAKAFIAARKTP